MIIGLHFSIQYIFVYLRFHCQTKYQLTLNLVVMFYLGHTDKQLKIYVCFSFRRYFVQFMVQTFFSFRRYFVHFMVQTFKVKILFFFFVIIDRYLESESCSTV